VKEAVQEPAKDPKLSKKTKSAKDPKPKPAVPRPVS